MFAERLKQLRAEKGVLQSDLATIANVSSKTISSYEQGNSEPNIDTLVKLSNYFSVSVDYLIGKTAYRTEENEAIAKSIPLPDNFIEHLKIFANTPLADIDRNVLDVINLILENDIFIDMLLQATVYITSSNTHWDNVIKNNELSSILDLSTLDAVFLARLNKHLDDALTEAKHQYAEQLQGV